MLTVTLIDKLEYKANNNYVILWDAQISNNMIPMWKQHSTLFHLLYEIDETVVEDVYDDFIGALDEFITRKEELIKYESPYCGTYEVAFEFLCEYIHNMGKHKDALISIAAN